MVEGFDHVPFNNMNAVRDAIGPGTCGIIVEPIQGEGGVRPADLQFLRDLRAVCDEYGIILGMDEVQSGMGRTGKLFAHEWAGITPDVMSSAKGIGGGFPLGAVLAKEQFAKALVPGTHGTTYGGNPLACAAGNAVLDMILAPGFLEEVERKGRKLRGELDKIAREFPTVFVDARGMGLLLGLKCAIPARPGAGRLRRRGPDGDHRRRQRAAPGAAAGGDRRRHRPGASPCCAAPRPRCAAALATRRRPNERVAPAAGTAIAGHSVRAGTARATSSICATSTPRRCARCWTSRPASSGPGACHRARSPARPWR